jgi:hypothetical protein
MRSCLRGFVCGTAGRTQCLCSRHHTHSHHRACSRTIDSLHLSVTLTLHSFKLSCLTAVAYGFSCCANTRLPQWSGLVDTWMHGFALWGKT